MKKAVILILLCGFLISCTTYRYHMPTPNPALFQDEGEVQFSGAIGTSGASLRAAYAFSNNFAAIGTYNAAFYDYNSSEGELGIGYYNNANPYGIFLASGIGFGSNYEYTDHHHTEKAYKGDFTRPFVQFNGGIAGGDLLWGIKGDAIGTIKANYLIYSGRHLDGTDDPISSEIFLLEPGFTCGIGGKSFRFDVSTSYPFSPIIKDRVTRNVAKTFPATLSLGIRFVFASNKTPH